MKQLEKQMISAYGHRGQRWLENLPGLIQDLTKRWNLENLTPFENLSWNYVAHGIQNQRRIILKLSCDLKSLNHEVQALRCFSVQAAVAVIEFDPLSQNVLLE